MTEHESSDALWEEFVREFEKNNAQHEPSAAERARPPKPRRRSRSWVVPLMVGLVVAAGVAGYRLQQPSKPAAPAAARPVASASASPSAADGSAVPSDGPSSKAAAAGATATQAVPLSVFPQQVKGYTLVAAVTNADCTGADTVGPILAGKITQSGGCLGVDLALYRDADGNQYNLALFTMKDPMDAMHLVTFLAADPMDYEVVVQLPPKDSGLRELPADSGMVQDFTSYGQGMLVGMAQWSDGRTADFNALVDRLSPLTKAVITRVPV
ncbi:hypothetical protein [Streptomyces sp. TLI_171]|uniref:hypothetical protein n=1 Tax=Streptomyces sp. TLI_171 TaxID=1938859 RepID=UPI000C180B0D|nr:hypothetical protein [Streptomyces sp. TLI_171]RKE23425.1 hypothetical protein BX266_6893 [Streptomyces sp. TLI_171]